MPRPGGTFGPINWKVTWAMSSLCRIGLPRVSSLPFYQRCFKPNSIWPCVGPTISAPTTYGFEPTSTSYGHGADRPKPFGWPLARWRLTLGAVGLRPLQGNATSEMYIRDGRPIRSRKLQKDLGFSGWHSVLTGTTIWHWVYTAAKRLTCLAISKLQRKWWTVRSP